MYVDVDLTITVDCYCGNVFDDYDSVWLDDEDWTPKILKCPECGREYTLNTHLELPERMEEPA
jgi:uncharacterized Zn-finger protein